MEASLDWFNSIVWGFPMLLLILGGGLYLTVGSCFAQFRLFPAALHRIFHPKDPSSHRALWTALAATVGTGNIAGVAGAICLGGPGALFWMWVSAFLGMAVKLAEATLAVRFSEITQNGVRFGGPMYVIQKGLPPKLRFFAPTYALFGVFAAFGIGNATQINAVISAMHEAFSAFSLSIPRWADCFAAFCIAAVYCWLFFGGQRLVGYAAEKVVIVASAGYLILGLIAAAMRFDRIPVVLFSVFQEAFHPRAIACGGAAGFFLCVRTGVSRGIFSNEAGLGTAAIAHAGAVVDHPVEQGIMGITEVFIDTIVICTITAMLIFLSDTPIPYGSTAGAELTGQALHAFFGSWGDVFLALALALFSLATILGWGMYGLACASYLLGEGCRKPFAVMQCIVIVLGAVLHTKTIWSLAEAVNGLMVLPNFIGILYLSPEFFRLIKEYRLRFAA